MSRRVEQKRAARALREQQAREARRRRTIRTSVVAALALVLVGAVGYAVYAAQRPAADLRVPMGATADRAGVQVGSGPVEVELYLDYLCPACRRFEAEAGPALREYLAQERITLVYHPVAILDRASTNRYSSRSAAGAGCAADAGALTQYTEVLYANQPAEGGAGHSDGELVDLAVAAGLPGDTFGQCLRDGAYDDWVKLTTDEMARRGVRGTPTVFVDGTRLDSPTAQTLAVAVAAAEAGQ